ncbi:MAG: alpha/beta fold hydrolase [Rhodocyclales bacterium GT-UBC]|nr:MAG: alpha/beta fold hydrolase [Rhodocyclales bacterium GT-UBC]
MPESHLFPPIQPRYVRQMAVGDGHSLHVEESGAVDGLPVVFLHDGPGEGCRAEDRRLFDPARFRLIMIDQRGAGHSQPQGEVDNNTTADLVLDLEYVREALGITAWIVFGHGWGCLLGLAYARLYPERLLGLVLGGVFLGQQAELPACLADESLFRQCAAGVLEGDPAAAQQAAHRWLNHERRLAGLAPLPAAPGPGQLAALRIRLHYLRRDSFLAAGQLLAGIEQLRHVPLVIVQGMADPLCLPASAEKLHRAWPDATWLPVHGSTNALNLPSMSRACIKALGWVAECSLVWA